MGLLASFLKTKLIQNMSAYRKSLHETSPQLMSSITVLSLMFSLPTNSKSMELNILIIFIYYISKNKIIDFLIIHHYENIILCWFFYYFFYYFSIHTEYISMIVQMTYNYMQLQTYLVN